MCPTAESGRERRIPIVHTGVRQLQPGKKTWKDLLREKSDPEIFEVTCKDGSRKIVQFRPVKLGAGENLMTCEDITDRIRAEEALRIRDSAMASSITGIAIADFDGTLTYVNPAALRLWGYDDEKEVLGRRAVEFL